VLSPAEVYRVSTALEHDAEVMSNTQLKKLLEGQPADVQAEIIRINTDARPIALQVALLVPLLAAVLGLVDSLRMMRQPDPTPSGAHRETLGLRAPGPPGTPPPHCAPELPPVLRAGDCRAPRTQRPTPRPFR